MEERAYHFLHGTGSDHRGRRIADYCAMTNIEWEKEHDFIQWAFPLPEASAYSKDAPVLSPEEVIRIQYDFVSSNALTLFYNRFMDFLGFGTSVFGHQSHPPGSIPSWLSRNNHNYKRITRCLKCLILFNHRNEVDELMQLLRHLYSLYPEVIGENTFSYWEFSSGTLPQ